MKPVSIYLVMALSLIIGTSAWAARVVLPLYALELGAEPLTVGILAATFSALPILLSVPAGKLADRFGPRRLLVFMTVQGALGMLLPYLFPGLPAIFAAAAMIGLASGIFDVLLQNVVGILSTPDTLARNFSNYSLMGSGTNLFGPLLGGFSIDRSDHATACVYLALLALVPLVMLAIMGGTLKASARQVKPVSGDIRAMLSEPAVRRVLATSSLLLAGRDLYRFYVPVYAHAIALSASTIGVVLAVSAAAEALVRVLLPPLIRRFKEEKLLAYACYFGAGCLVLIPLFKGAVMLGLISVIFGLGMGCAGPIVALLMFGNAPDGRSGEALGLKVTVNHLTRLVGPILFGSLANAFGLAPMFWINALMLGIGGILSRSGKRGQ